MLDIVAQALDFGEDPFLFRAEVFGEILQVRQQFLATVVPGEEPAQIRLVLPQQA